MAAWSESSGRMAPVQGAGGDVKAVLSLNIGYRSLIDWTSTPVWAQDPTLTLEKDWRTSKEGASQLGITTTPSGTLRPQPWTGSGPPERPGGKKLPGNIGVAYNVRNPSGPSFGRASSNEELTAAFGNYTPQWLYRLAEIAQYESGPSLQELKDAGAFPNSRHPSDRQDVTDPWGGRVTDPKEGFSISKEQYQETALGRGISLHDRKGKVKTKKILKQQLKFGKGTTASLERALNPNPNYDVSPDSNVFALGDAPDPLFQSTGSDSSTLAGRTQQVAGNLWQRLPTGFLASGSKTRHYTRTFTESVYDNMSSSVTTHLQNLRRAIMRNADALGDVTHSLPGTLGSQTSESGPMADEVGERSSGMVQDGVIEGGQTGQEKLTEVLGIGVSPDTASISGTRLPDPSVAPYGSQFIDIVLNQETVNANQLSYSRANLTTSTYQSIKSHHGIGGGFMTGRSTSTAQGAYPRDTQAAVDRGRASVASEQQQQIVRYNDMIDELYVMFGVSTSTSVQDLRQHIAQITQGSGQGPRSLQNLFGIRDAFLKSTKGIIDKTVKAEMMETINHVLHSMGNFLASDPHWVNVMGYMMEGAGGQYRGTLIIHYHFDGQGRFLDLTEADIEILTYSVEEYLYNLAGPDIRAEMTLAEFMTEANTAFALIGHEQQANEAGMHRVAHRIGSAPSTHLRMPIEAEMSAAMDVYTTQIILGISMGLEADLQQQLITEATTFSGKMRRELQMNTQFTEYMQAISDIFLNGTEIGRGSFWFLWAAPFMSTAYQQVGHAKQAVGQTGGTGFQSA